MQPRFTSSVVSLRPFVQQVFRCTEDEWRKLPPQARGYVLHNQHKGLTAGRAITCIESGQFSGSYDPQGTFDAFQGTAPA